MRGRTVLCGSTCLLACCVYLNTLTADFAYDDSRAVQKNQDLLPETPLWNVFYDDFWGTPLTHSGSHKSYRPLCVLTFRLNYLLHGLQPRGFHLLNVLLHGAVTGLFTFTAHLLLGRPRPAALAGALFAVHPVHTEAVAGIVGRADILACLFYLLTFLAYINYCKLRDRRPASQNGHAGSRPAAGSASRRLWLLAATAVLTAAAMLCKELGLTVLAVCAAYDLFVHSRLRVRDLLTIKQRRGTCEGLLSLLATGLGLLTFRLYFMGSKPPEFAPADNPASDNPSLLTRTLTFHYLPFANVWLLLCPVTLSFDWSMDAVPLVEGLWDGRNLCTAALYGALLTTCSVLLTRLNHVTHKRPHHSNGHVTSPVTNCANTYGKSANSIRRRHPVSHTNGNGFARRGSSSSSSSSDGDDVTGERLRVDTQRSLRVVSVGLVMMVAPFLPASNLFFYVGFVLAERVLYIPSMGFCILVAEGAYILSRRWATHKAYLRAMTVVIATILVLFTARTVVRNADWSTEETLYRAGISVNPAKAWGNLANILNSQGKTSEAEQAYRSALQHRGNMADVHYNLSTRTGGQVALRAARGEGERRRRVS